MLVCIFGFERDGVVVIVAYPLIAPGDLFHKGFWDKCWHKMLLFDDLFDFPERQ